MQRAWSHRRAGECGDRLGGRVRLLRGDPAVLDSEVGAVAGKHAVEPRDAAMGVDRDEAVASADRYTGQRRPEQLRQATIRSTVRIRDPGVIETRPGAGVSV